MGQPEVLENVDLTTVIAQALLDPAGTVTMQQLYESGLHVGMVQTCFAVLQPSIGDLTGWKELSQYEYSKTGYLYELDDIKRAQAANERWELFLRSNGLDHTMATLIYNGEARPAPAPDYRLYLLRNGRILVFLAGFHAGSHRRGDKNDGMVGSVEEVLAHLGEGEHRSLETEPFVIMVKAFSDALQTAIVHREKVLAEQRIAKDRLDKLIARVVGR